MTCPLSESGSHYWLLPQGLHVTGQCHFCGLTKDFESTLVEKVTPPKRTRTEIEADAYEMGLALSLARDSGCRINNFNNRGGRA